MTAIPCRYPLVLRKLFLAIIISEKTVPDLFIGYKHPVNGVNEKRDCQDDPHRLVDCDKVAGKHKYRKAEIEEDHQCPEDRKDPVIHFSAVHCDQVNLTNILFISFFVADRNHYVAKKREPRVRLPFIMTCDLSFCCIFKPLHYREDECSREQAADDKYSPELPEFNLVPQFGADKEKLVSNCCGKEPSGLHESLEP